VSATESQRLFSASVLLATENKLFLAAGHWPLKIKPYFWLIFSGGQEPPKISLRPPKIAYFQRFRAAENDCSYCSGFSKLKVLISYLFSTMTYYLATIALKSEALDKIKYKHIIFYSKDDPISIVFITEIQSSELCKHNENEVKGCNTKWHAIGQLDDSFPDLWTT
jgi:hypothetical protein